MRSRPEEPQKFWPLFLRTLPLAIILFILFMVFDSWSRSRITFTSRKQSYSMNETLSFTLRNDSLLPLKYNIGCDDQVINIEVYSGREWITKSGLAVCSKIPNNAFLWPFGQKEFTLNLAAYHLPEGAYRFGTYVEPFSESRKYFFAQRLGFVYGEFVQTGIIYVSK